jgi:hypothetical protein
MERLNNKGFSLVELVVVMGIFIGVMIMISASFESILGTAGHMVKSVETNTEGIIGLEMLRRDVEHAGFGLPWTIPSPPPPAVGFPETSAGLDYPVKGITASSFQTIESAGAPSAIRTAVAGQSGKKILDGSANTNPGTAYLVIKSTNVALNDTAKKWSYVSYQDTAGTNTSFIKPWGTVADDFVTGEQVITISSTFDATGAPDKKLVKNGTAFSYTISGATPYQPTGFQPTDGTQQYLVYGIDPSAALTMPYNRADYYIKKPDSTPAQYSIPTHCNPGTGVLYKGVVPQGSTTTFTEYPLLNCVGDMQVEFELDPGNNGNITYSPDLIGMDAATIRSKLKNVRVYILAHEGKKDRNYTYPNSLIKVGDPARPSSSGRTWDGTDGCSGDNCMQTVFGTDWKNYRWKVYTIVVHPKNLD